MDLQLKAIQVNLRMSEETHNYSATIYLDGKKVGTTGNDGHGGIDRVWWDDRAAGEKIEAYFASLPKVHFDDDEDGMQPDFELWCGEQVELHLVMKDTKRRAGKRIVMLEGGNMYSFKLTAEDLEKATSSGTTVRATIENKHPNGTIINGLTDEELKALLVEQKVIDQRICLEKPPAAA